MIVSAFTDGGVVGPNPSKLGATWAWCHVGEGNVLADHAYGLVEPADAGAETLSNNFSELYAAVRCLEALPAGWAGTLHTDSSITKVRLEGSPKLANLPRWLIDRLLAVRRGRKYDVVLVGGHPTRADLARGYKLKNGLPVSSWNCWCDQQCTAAAGRFKAMLQREGVA